VKFSRLKLAVRLFFSFGRQSILASPKILGNPAGQSLKEPAEVCLCAAQLWASLAITAGAGLTELPHRPM